MATLTSDELTHIRNNIGDTGSTPKLGDSYLQYIHDNDGASTIDFTIYYAIRALMGLAAPKVANSNANSGDSKSYQQEYDHYLSLEKLWGRKTGLSASTVTTGSINLGIDEEDSSFNIT